MAMKLKLPDGTQLSLDTSLELEDRKKVVDEILEEWKQYFTNSWDLNKTKVCLEVLSNYLCMVKDGEMKNKEDKYILSSDKMKKMKRFNDKNVNFSNLPKDQQKVFGLINFDDEGDRND